MICGSPSECNSMLLSGEHLIGVEGRSARITMVALTIHTSRPLSLKVTMKRREARKHALELNMELNERVKEILGMLAGLRSQGYREYLCSVKDALNDIGIQETFCELRDKGAFLRANSDSRRV